MWRKYPSSSALRSLVFLDDSSLWDTFCMTRALSRVPAHDAQKHHLFHEGPVNPIIRGCQKNSTLQSRNRNSASYHAEFSAVLTLCFMYGNRKPSLSFELCHYKVQQHNVCDSLYTAGLHSLPRKSLKKRVASIITRCHTC